jgi:hypothetical protein
MDSGYQGTAEIHRSSETPKKKPKGGELTQEEKLENRRISRNEYLSRMLTRKSKYSKLWRTGTETAENAIVYALILSAGLLILSRGFSFRGGLM